MLQQTARRQTKAGSEQQNVADAAAERVEAALGEADGHPEHEMQDAEGTTATPAFEDPLTVLPSVESAMDTVTPGESEFLTVSASDPQFRGQLPFGVRETHIPLNGGFRPGLNLVHGMLRQVRLWFLETLPALRATGPGMRWLSNINIVGNAPADSLLDQLEMLTTHPVRNMLRRNPRMSPPGRIHPSAQTPTSIPKRATEGSEVLRPRLATPIRRSRSSYSLISQSRRTEASGRIDRTLYRLPDLLSQKESSGASPPPESQQHAEIEQNGPATPTTPETHPPSAPMTAPAAATATDPNGSPSFPRWIFNNLSRKWTSIRERLGTRPATPANPNIDVEQAPAPTPLPTSSTLEESTAPSAPTAVTAPPSEEVVSLPPPSYRPRRASLHIPRPSGPRRPPRRRVSTTTPAQKPAVVKPVPSESATARAPTKLPYDLFPAGFSQELLDRCYAGSTKPRTLGSRNVSNAQPAQPAQPPQSIQPTQPVGAPEASVPNEDQTLKRKREPETIPNPRGCSYGMDMDFFEFTEEEWAEEDKRQAALAAAQETAAPAAKKQRVGDRQQQRRRVNNRTTPSNVPPSALSPSRRPGFIPNRRGTYQAPELPTIDSSGFLTDTGSSPSVQPQASPFEIRDRDQPESITAPPLPMSTDAPKISDNAGLQASAKRLGIKSGMLKSDFLAPVSFVVPPDKYPMSVPEGRRVLTNTRGTFQTPDSDDSDEEEEKFRHLSKREWQTREVNKVLHQMGLECDRPRVVTNAELATDPRYVSIFEDAYKLKPPSYTRTKLDEKRAMWRRIPPKPLHIVYPGGAFRPYTPNLDEPLYRVDRWGNLRPFLKAPLEQNPHNTAANMDYQSSDSAAQEPADGAESRGTADVADTTDAAEVAQDTEPSDASVDTSVQGPSPLTRARNKAEQFKPKTPSRLRESYRFSSSTNSLTAGTPSQLGGVLDTSSFLSDPMSLDGSLGHVITAEDIDWLHELCPDGDLGKLPWPDRMGLAKTLDVDSSAAAIVDQNWTQQKAGEAYVAWKGLFERYEQGDLEL